MRVPHARRVRTVTPEPVALLEAVHRGWWADFALIGLAGVLLLAVSAVSESAPIVQPLRVLLGLAFVFYILGYCLVAALFPRVSDLDGPERVGLRLGLGVAMISVLALVLDRLPWGLGHWQVLIGTLALASATAAVALWRRRRLFRAVFRHCAGCGQYTGDECWNVAAARCFTCAPDRVAQDLAQAYASAPGPVCATCGMPMPRETRQVAAGAPLAAMLGRRHRRLPDLHPLAARLGAVRARTVRRARALSGAAQAALVWPVRALASGLRAIGSRAAMPSAAAWRSLRPLTPLFIAVLVVGGVALLTRDRPDSGGATSEPVGVVAPTSPRGSAVASASPVVSASPVAGGGATPTADSTPETRPTPPLTGEQPRVEVSRSTVRAWQDALGTVRAHVVVEVRNDGPGPAALRSGTVSYTLRDAGGTLIYEGLFAYAFPSRLRPTESAYLVDTVTLEFVDPTEVGRVEVVLKPVAATRDSARLQVEDVAWKQAAFGSGLEVTGRVANLGTEVHDALVAVILLDAQGAILGAVYDNADAARIAAGGRAEFRTAYPGTPPLAPTDVAEVLAIAFDP